MTAGICLSAEQELLTVTQLVRFRLTYKFGGGKKQSMEQKSVANDVGRFRE